MKFTTLGLADLTMETNAWQPGQDGVPPKIGLFATISAVSLLLGVVYLRSIEASTSRNARSPGET